MTYYVRRMHQEDIPQVIEIDREAFPTEWPPPNFKHELQNRVAYYLVVCDSEREKDRRQFKVPLRKGISGFIARFNDLISYQQRRRNNPSPPNDQYMVGFASCWIMADEAHITSIASRKSNRQRGIGELLLIALADMSIRLRARIITLEVRISNTVAQKLYAKYGFNEVGVRRGYYLDNHEDAIIMTTEDIGSDTFQARLKKLKRVYSAKWGITDYQVSE